MVSQGGSLNFLISEVLALAMDYNEHGFLLEYLLESLVMTNFGPMMIIGSKYCALLLVVHLVIP